MIVRAAIAAGLLVLLLGVYALWKRPPRRLGQRDFASLGIPAPSIVQFATAYCAPCKAAVPHLQAAADRAQIPFVQIDVGERPEVAREYGIRSVPTIAVTGRGARLISVWTALPADGEIAEATGRAKASV